MLIQVEKIYLFETSVSDPFFFGEKDGVTALLLNPRIIEQINIKTVYFFLDSVAKGGLTYTMKYGGEDADIFDNYGKSEQDYKLEFNLPTISQRVVEEMTGKQFSLLAMRRDGSHFIIFAQFTAEPFEVDNIIQKRMVLRATNTNARLFNVQSFNIETIIESITEDDLEGLNSGGFDYEFDLQFD